MSEKKMKTPLFEVFFFILSLGLIFWWATLQYFDLKNTINNYRFNIGVGAFYLMAGGMSVYIGVKNKLMPYKKFFQYFGYGLISWSLGAFIWGYFNIVTKSEIPYPSIADIFFFFYSFFIGAAFWHYFDVFKAHITRHSVRDSLIIIVGVYFLIFFVLYQPTYDLTLPFIEVAANYLHPLTGALILSFAIVFLRIRDNRSDWSILGIIISLVFQVSADILFSYRTSNGLYWNGDISDFLYLISAITVVFGLLTIWKTID